MKIELLDNGIEAFVTPEHTFGTDAVLLARFAQPKKQDKALDFGTGCGIIPLLWCGGEAPAYAVGVEIQLEAAKLAQQSVERNGLHDRLKIVCADLRTLKGDFEGGGFDLITCNPPYKRLSEGIRNPSEAKTTARHEVSCTFPEVLAAAAKLLRYGGIFCTCLRPERLVEALCAVREAGMEPKRLRFVQHRQDIQPFLFLLEARRGGNPGLRVEPVLLVCENEYSRRYGEK